ncbi:MAG: prepilin-type cleavage/methylation domain-containing protein [Pirellulales bacterium]|nr:prepilin-type cleavage/methylation domain-containing protein [Pirellulales bacterium]
MALALLAGCVVVLSRLAKIGRDHAESADELAVAQLACQSKLNEILAGAAPAESTAEAPLPEMPGWLVSVDVAPTGRPGLAALTVTAAEEVLDEEEKPRARSFALVRWIRDPLAGAKSTDGGFVTEPFSPPTSSDEEGAP